MRVRHFGYVISDEEKMEKFYIKILGFKKFVRKRLKGKYINDLIGIDDLTYIKLKDDTDIPCLEFHIWNKIRSTVYKKKNFHIAITVDNINKLANKLIEQRVEMVSTPLIAPDSGNKVCFCYDFEGNLVELVEEKKC